MRSAATWIGDVWEEDEEEEEPEFTSKDRTDSSFVRLCRRHLWKGSGVSQVYQSTKIMSVILFFPSFEYYLSDPGMGAI